MSAETWVNETLYTGWGQRFSVKHELAHVQSEFQNIEIFESHTHGRVLMLDGIVQIAESHEFAYLEMLTHVPLLAHGEPMNVLVIGGGDGGPLPYILRHPSVRRVVVVDIDPDVVRLVQEHLPGLAGDAWDDPRTELIIGDGIKYVEEASDAAFDLIIVDSTHTPDPVGVAETLFTDDFYQNCARILTPRGLMVNQCGVPFMHAADLARNTLRRGKYFPSVTAYLTSSPCYVGGLIALGWAAKDPSLASTPMETIRARASEARILGNTDYWTPEIHVGAFNLPPYIARHLPSA